MASVRECENNHLLTLALQKNPVQVAPCSPLSKLASRRWSQELAAIVSVSFPCGCVKRPARWITVLRNVSNFSKTHSVARLAVVPRVTAEVCI